MMQYRQHRYATEYPIEVRTPSGQQKVHVVDVNRKGVRIEGLQNIERGQRIQLNILSCPVDAIVQWVAGGLAGLTFRPQITEDQVDTLRYRRDARAVQRRGAVGFGFAEMR